MPLRPCLLPPPRDAFEAAQLLNMAVDAHLRQDQGAAEHFIRAADNPVIRDWTESLWGKQSPNVVVQLRIPAATAVDRVLARMPNSREKAELHFRDGYHCRFCALPVIRADIRKRIVLAYPDAVPWGRTNLSQHAAFQAMWAQYDHLVPHCKGGDNTAGNMVVTCAPCNFARMDYLLEEVGLANPLLRDPILSDWDGLERFN